MQEIPTAPKTSWSFMLNLGLHMTQHIILDRDNNNVGIISNI